MKPLRDLGIPAAGIVDIDVLKEGGTVWSSFLDAGHIPDIDRQSLATSRAAIKQAFDATRGDMKRDGGINLLNATDKESASNLFESLENYGLFVIRHGELESWLKQLGVTGHGPSWLISMFEHMGADPDQSSYVRPTDDDVWSFIALIKKWLSNPQRKGIPT